MPRLALAALAAALLVPAAAAADTLVLRPLPERVASAATFRVAYTGLLVAGPVESVYATLFSYLDPGRGPCAPSQALERDRPDSRYLHMVALWVAGPFALRRPAVLPRPGLYRICAYLQHHAPPASAPDAFATALVRGLNPRP